MWMVGAGFGPQPEQEISSIAGSSTCRRDPGASVRQLEIGHGEPPGLTTQERARLKEQSSSKPWEEGGIGGGARDQAGPPSWSESDRLPAFLNLLSQGLLPCPSSGGIGTTSRLAPSTVKGGWGAGHPRPSLAVTQAAEPVIQGLDDPQEHGQSDLSKGTRSTRSTWQKRPRASQSTQIPTVPSPQGPAIPRRPQRA